MTQQPPGWYSQPDGTRRYWDGTRWTEHAAPAPNKPLPAAAPQPGRAQPGSGPSLPPQAGVIPPQQPAPAGAPTKKPIWQRKRVIIPVAAVVALFGIGALSSQGENSTGAQPASPAASSQPAESPGAGASESPDDQASESPEAEEARTFTMPDLVGKSLQEAQNELQALGSRELQQEDASGQGRAQIVDSNWKVCAQDPAAGQEVPTSTTVVLSSVKEDEYCPGEAPKLAKIGDTVRVGDLAVTVKSAERKNKLSNVFGSKKGHWMLLTVKIANKGKEQEMVNSSDFTLIEPDGTEYSTDSDSMTYIDTDDWLFLEEINPKTSATGKVLFAIPKSAKKLTLRVSTGLFGSETVDISLGKK